MIGANISRWTMSYFAMAFAWLFVALALMVAGIGFPAARSRVARYARPGACGLHRLAQHRDVRRAVPVRARPGRKASVFGALGLAGLGPADRGLRAARRFLALGGRLPAWLWLLPLGAVLLVAGFGLVVVDSA